MLLLFFLLKSYLKFFISLTCGLVISIFFPCALDPRRPFEFLQTGFCSLLFGEEFSATDMEFRDFAVKFSILFLHKCPKKVAKINTLDIF